MNTQSYGYVILVALIGMGIVFVFLTILSLLMTAIQSVFRERDGAQATPLSAAPEDSESDELVPVQYRGNRWLIAAVAAYLDLEELDSRSDPSPWVSGRSVHTDPWLTAPRRDS